MQQLSETVPMRAKYLDQIKISGGFDLVDYCCDLVDCC